MIEKRTVNYVRLFLLMLGLTGLVGCVTAPTKTSQHPDPLCEEFTHLATASISDAVDTITGRRGFMSHEIKPLFPVKMAGRAVTVLSKPSTKSEPPSMALELVDTCAPGHVLVLVMDGPDGADVAAFGGIMCTGASSRGFAGAVMDAGCRDVTEIEAMNFPVFTRGIVPSNSLGRYVNTAKNAPVLCGGVTVNPGDIIIGDRDGVVVVPKEHAEEILRLAQELEAKEAITAKTVKELKSIRKAVQKHNRI